MDFAREDDGRISQRFFGAHTFRRTAFAGDYTGLEIQRTLVGRAEQLHVPILDHVYITRLLVRDNVVFGAYGFDQADGTRYLIHADAVILAAGGHNRIWRRTSSRRDENTGDSFRLAVEAGRAAARPGAGAVPPVRHHRARERGGHPDLRGGARRGRHPAQRARRAVHGEVRPRADGAVDPRPRRARRVHRDRRGARHRERRRLARRLAPAARDDHDAAAARLPDDARTADARHHHRLRSRSRRPRTTRWAGCGCAPDDHQTDVEGLYAIGEASSGLHGANRLGGNSLIELLVYGRIVGQAAVAFAEAREAQQRSAVAVDARAFRDRRICWRRTDGRTSAHCNGRSATP